MFRRLRRLLRRLRWPISAALALLASLVFHLPQEEGRRALTRILNVGVTHLIAGRLHVGSMPHLGLDGIELREIELFEPSGRRAIVAHRARIVLDLDALLEGRIRIAHVRVQGGVLLLRPTQTSPISFLDALALRTPGDDPPSDHPRVVVVDDMHLDGLRAYGSFLGAEGLHARDLTLHMGMRFGGDADIRIYSARGRVDAPIPFVGVIDAVAVRISTNPYVGITADARTHYEDERLRAHVRLAVPRTRPPTTPPELDLTLALEPVNLETVAALGFDFAQPLHGRARGHVRLLGPLDHLGLSVALDHAAGPIVIDGVLPADGRVRLEGRTTGIELSRLVHDAPPITLAGRFSLAVLPEGPGSHPRVEAVLDPFEAEGYRVPPLTLRASLEPQRVLIETVDGPYGTGGRIHVDGEATYEGDVHLRIAGDLGEIGRDPNVQRHAAGARGAVSVDATIDHSATGTRVTASGRVRGASFGSVSASDLGYDVRSRTTDGGTDFDAALHATDLRLGSFVLGDGDARVEGRGDTNHVHGSFLDFRTTARTSLDVTVTTRGSRVRVDGPSISYSRRGETLEVHADGILFDPHRTVAVEGLRATFGGDTVLRTDGVWSGRGSDTFSIVVGPLDLGRLSTMLAPTLPPMGGRVRGAALVGGDLEVSPLVSMELSLEDVSVRTLEDLSGALSIDFEDGALGGKLDVDAGAAGDAVVMIRGAMPHLTLPTLAESIRDGEYDFQANLNDIDLGILASGLAGVRDAGVRGCLDGSMRLGGFIAYAPTFEADVSAGHLVFGESPPLEVALTSQYNGQNLEVTGSLGPDVPAPDHPNGRCSETARADLAAGGEHRALAELYASIQAPLLALVGSDGPISELLTVLPWTASLRVPPRLLGTLPRAMLDHVPASARELEIGASVSALGGFGPMQASLSASVIDRHDYSDEPCATDAQPRALVLANLVGGELIFGADGFSGVNRLFSGIGRMPLPVDEWLYEGEIGSTPPAAVDLAFTTASYASLGDMVPSVEASEVPYLCSYFSGPFYGEVHVRELFTDEPTLAGVLTSTALQFHRLERTYRGTSRSAVEQTPVIPDIAFKFQGDARELRFNHDMVWWDEGSVTQISGALGWTWNAETIGPVIADDAPIHATISSETQDDGSPGSPSTIPLRLVAGWLPMFGAVDGDMQTTLTVDGTLDQPLLAGDVTIDDATLVLAGVGQRLRNVHAEIGLEPGRLEIRSLRATDDDGATEVHGAVTMEGFATRDFELELESDNFPIRDQGLIIGRLTGSASVEGTIGDASLETTIRVTELAVELTPPAQTPIGLGEHPDIRIVGASAIAPELEEAYPIHVVLPQTPRFWVRGEDFAAEVSTELDLTLTDAATRIVGHLELHRGYFDVMGKRFEVDQGTMVFAGGTEIDPQISLVATYHMRIGYPNEVVVVRASGTLSAPVVQFTSPMVADGDQGRILCILITGRTSGTCGNSTDTGTASNGAVSFLTSVAFGVATMALRENLGEFLPMLAVETGNTSRSARVRAGFTFDTLLPDALRRFVQSIYIEGYYNGDQGQGGANVEVQFPHNIVTRGEVGPGSAWRINATWEP